LFVLALCHSRQEHKTIDADRSLAVATTEEAEKARAEVNLLQTQLKEVQDELIGSSPLPVSVWSTRLALTP